MKIRKETAYKIVLWLFTAFTVAAYVWFVWSMVYLILSIIL